ncbi:MAG: uroporphyrinogen decarboxylase family protein [Chloroflexota bacterium]|nr:uroporphyrinogen decarboxylase family protein [Chloroflexota bacterium]
MSKKSNRPSRELVRSVLRGERPEELPCGELVIEDEFVRDLIGLDEETVSWSARYAVLRRLNQDLVVVPFSSGWGSPTQPDTEEAEAALEAWHADSDLFVFALVDGPFSAAARAWGWESALMRLTSGGKAEQRFMAESVVMLAEMAGRLRAKGADGIIIGDDIAYRRATYISPKALRQNYFPYLTVLVEAIQSAGHPVVFHSDGNLWAIMDDLLETGIDGLQGMEPGAAMNMTRVREHAGPQLCLWGNIDVGWLAVPRGIEEIQRYVADMLHPLIDTSVILGTSGGLMPGIPGANLETLYQVGKNIAN